MKYVHLALIGAAAVALIACDASKQESKAVPEELPVNKDTTAVVAPAPDTTLVDSTEAKPEVKKPSTKPSKKPASTKSTNVQKSTNRDIPTTAAPTNVQKRKPRE